MTDTDVAQTRTLQCLWIKISQIMKMFVLQSGCYENVQCTSKDLYNKLDAARRKEIMAEDAESAIAYLSAKNDADPLFSTSTF